MDPKEFLAKRKVHLFFGSIFLFALLLNIMIAVMPGQTFLGATLKAIGEVRPMEYIMIALFWYSCAVHRPKDDWDSSLISLNLSKSNNRKWPSVHKSTKERV